MQCFHLVFIPISIHALRKESDTEWDVTRAQALQISIHALRKESDAVICDMI